MSFNDCVLFQYDYLLVVHEEAGPFSFTVYANFTVYSRKLKLGRSLTDAPFSDPFLRLKFFGLHQRFQPGCPQKIPGEYLN